MSLYGYARVSTIDQNMGTQIEELKKYGCIKIFRDKVTGVAEKKPQFDKLMTLVNKGDTIVVTRIDRLGRNTLQTLQLIEELNERGVKLEILNLPFDANNSMGRALMQVAMVFAQLERDMIKEKQRAGIELAKKQGKYKGRPRQLTKNNVRVRVALEEFAKGQRTVKEICDLYGISRASLYRVAKVEGIERGEENAAKLGQKRRDKFIPSELN